MLSADRGKEREIFDNRCVAGGRGGGEVEVHEVMMLLMEGSLSSQFFEVVPAYQRRQT